MCGVVIFVILVIGVVISAKTWNVVSVSVMGDLVMISSVVVGIVIVFIDVVVT